MLLVLVVPAFAEELLFRALPVPRPGDRFEPWQALLCVAAFVAWHPFQAVTFGPPWSALWQAVHFLKVASPFATSAEAR